VAVRGATPPLPVCTRASGFRLLLTLAGIAEWLQTKSDVQDEGGGACESFINRALTRHTEPGD